MKFGEQFELHKIPEFYNKYLNYEIFKREIEIYKQYRKEHNQKKLNGYYLILKRTKAIVKIDPTKYNSRNKLLKAIRKQQMDDEIKGFDNKKMEKVRQAKKNTMRRLSKLRPSLHKSETPTELNETPKN